ncbi:hypothetical protein BC937DRAFT_93437, partial [Endogone sp. FLAS-F59071]
PIPLNDLDMSAIIDIRRRAQSAFKTKKFQESLSLYTESLTRFSTDPIAFIERAIVFARLNYPALVLCDAQRALRIFESIGGDEQYLILAYNADQSSTDHQIPGAAAKQYRDETYTNICFCHASALRNLHLYNESIPWYEKCSSRATSDAERQQLNLHIQNIKQHKSGGSLDSTNRYPWDIYNKRKNDPAALLSNIKSTIESGSYLTVKKIEIYSSDEQPQFGIFTTKQTARSQPVFTEMHTLCVHSAVSPVCDHCNADLWDDPFRCPRCSTAYCDQNCRMAAQNLYHDQLCTKDISVLTRDINSASSTKSLIPLQILKLFAISITTGIHPLDQPLVRNLAHITFERGLHRPYSLQSLDNYTAIIDILDLRQFRSDFDYWIYLTLENLLVSNIFAHKTSEGVPWKAYIFPHIAMFNHSCTPNASLSMEGIETKIVASSILQPGDEVVISYIDNMARVEERQKILLHGWGFVCRCAKCIREGAI